MLFLSFVTMLFSIDKYFYKTHKSDTIVKKEKKKKEKKHKCCKRKHHPVFLQRKTCIVHQ